MHSTFAPPRTARHARAVAGLEARFLARHALCVSALRLGAARLYESRAPALGTTAATACSLPAATGARRVAVRRLLMLLPRRAVVHPRSGTQLEGGVGDRRAGSLSSADAASLLGGGSCFAARVARRRTRLRSAAAASSERAGIAPGRARASRETRCDGPRVNRLSGARGNNTVRASSYFETCDGERKRRRKTREKRRAIAQTLSLRRIGVLRCSGDRRRQNASPAPGHCIVR